MFEKEIEVLELDLYDAPACYEQAEKLHGQACQLFNDVLDHYRLTYLNPGEAEAENEDRSVIIPLSGYQADLWTCEEEDRMMKEDWELPLFLFGARLWAQRAKDIVEDGWQHGLEEITAEGRI